jgi:hypothetical protein
MKTRLASVLGFVVGLAVLSGALVAAPAQAAHGDLQLVDCIASDAEPGCPEGPVVGPGAPAVSPDGSQLFETVQIPSLAAGLDVYNRGADGRLTTGACFGTASGFCTGVASLSEATSVAVSPDGAAVFVGGRDLTVFHRTTTGVLSYVACFGPDVGCGAGPGEITSLAVRNDIVAVVSSGTDTVASFARSGDTLTYAGSTTDGGRLTAPSAVVVAPHASEVYVASYETPYRVATVLFNPSTKAVSSSLAPAYCVAVDDVPNDCGNASPPALREATGLVISPDGRQLYVTTRYPFKTAEAVERIDVDVDSGNLSYHPGGCWIRAKWAAGAGGCVATPGLAGAGSIAISADGSLVYAGSLDGTGGSPGGIVGFSRGADGQLTPLPAATGCLSGDAVGDSAGCGTLVQPEPVSGLVLAPDGQTLYAVGHDAAGASPARMWTFRVGQAPPPPSRIGARIKATFRPGRTATTVTRLKVTGLPAGAAVTTSCTPPKHHRAACPFRTKRVKVTGAVANVAKALRHRPLGVKARLELTITAPGYLPEIVGYRIRAGRKPKVTGA